MSAVNMCKGTEPREKYSDIKTSDGSGDYKCDIVSSETVRNVQNVDFHIKEELNMCNSIGPYGCNVTYSTEHQFDYSSSNSGTTDLHVHADKRSNFILKNEADYAVA